MVLFMGKIIGRDLNQPILSLLNASYSADPFLKTS